MLDEPAVLEAVGEAKGVLADLATADVRATRLDLAWAASEALEKVAEGLEPPKHHHYHHHHSDAESSSGSETDSEEEVDIFAQ